MKNKIGVMQGRLLPKFQGRYQAHPVGYWKKEFQIAQHIGLGCIEFILDFNDAEENPLLKAGGIDEIKTIVEKTGVTIQTICADYFMEAPLHSEDTALSERSQQIMNRLLNSAEALRVTDVVIPCVDQSSLNGQDAADRFVQMLLPLVKIAEEKKINLALETDLPPKPFIELLDRFNSDRVTINYDIGNSAALGYDPIEELNAYGTRITDIHIKDRFLNGGPAILGKGGADFISFFNKLLEVKYKGPFIMQAYRDDEGLEVFKQQLDWIRPYLEIV
jgi:L-ribulose-5-phosphate 3-epimerase